MYINKEVIINKWHRKKRLSKKYIKQGMRSNAAIIFSQVYTKYGYA